jgi:hypothetical protein
MAIPEVAIPGMEMGVGSFMRREGIKKHERYR